MVKFIKIQWYRFLIVVENLYLQVYENLMLSEQMSYEEYYFKVDEKSKKIAKLHESINQLKK